MSQDSLEAIPSVRGLAKNEDGLVLPLGEDEEEQIELLKDEVLAPPLLYPFPCSLCLPVCPSKWRS